MTVNGICHEVWQADTETHVCGRPAGHGGLGHLCPCGTLLYQANHQAWRKPEPTVEWIFDDGEGLRYSLHASERRAHMNVRHHEVRQALQHPELTYPADKRAPGGKCYQAGRIVVITNHDGLVITLLWHGAEGRDDHGQPLAGTV